MPHRRLELFPAPPDSINRGRRRSASGWSRCISGFGMPFQTIPQPWRSPAPHHRSLQTDNILPQIVLRDVRIWQPFHRVDMQGRYSHPLLHRLRRYARHCMLPGGRPCGQPPHIATAHRMSRPSRCGDNSRSCCRLRVKYPPASSNISHKHPAQSRRGRICVCRSNCPIRHKARRRNCARTTPLLSARPMRYSRFRL